MKKDKNFFFFLAMIFFIIVFTTSLILGFRTLEIVNLTVAGSILIYPATYFIALSFKEKYGMESTRMLFNYSIFALIFMVLLFTLSSALPYKAPDGLEPLYNFDYRIIFAYIAAFMASHYLGIYLYDYLTGIKGFKFLISTVIAISIDSIIFIGLAHLGHLPFIEITKLFVGQYVFNILMVIIYSILFTYAVEPRKKHKK